MIRRANSLVIEKTRYQMRHMGHLWEIDVYEGAHRGLVIAEVELKDEGECVALPAWVGREVTGDRRYSNQALSRWSISDRPFQGHGTAMIAAAI